MPLLSARINLQGKNPVAALSGESQRLTGEMREGQSAQPCGQVPMRFNQQSLQGNWNMAARLNKLHQDDIRSKIQASQLVNVLQNHALKGGADLSQSRMKAIEILLRKSVPDLSAISLGGDVSNPLNVQFNVKFD